MRSGYGVVWAVWMLPDGGMHRVPVAPVVFDEDVELGVAP